MNSKLKTRGRNKYLQHPSQTKGWDYGTMIDGQSDYHALMLIMDTYDHH